jgi:hypothetical protein
MVHKRWFWLLVTGGVAALSLAGATAAVERASAYFPAYVVCLSATLTFLLLCLTALEDWLGKDRLGRSGRGGPRYRSVGVCQDLWDDQ